MPRGGTGVVVPIRAFAGGLGRLSGYVSDGERADLARRFADRVVAAAGGLPVVIVSSAPEVEAWARGLDLPVIGDPGGLDAAAATGRSWVEGQRCSRLIVAHADLPFARSLTPVATDDERPLAIIVPCHRDDGTPVMSLPVDAPFEFAYGPGSFRRHVDEARRCGLEVRVRRDPDLAFDVDTPEDLERVRLAPRS